MAEYEEQPETQEEMVRRVVSEIQKTHAHRDWGPMDCRTLLTVEHQADVTLDQDNPVSGTRYVVLDTVLNARIIGISVQVTWTDQPTPLEAWLLIDGQTERFYMDNPVTATNYFPAFKLAAAASSMTSTDYTIYKPFLVEGRSIRIEVETTGGTVSNLSARVKWARRI